MGSRWLLIVEDDDRTRRALGRLFKHKGWGIIEASTVAEGIAKLDPAPDCAVIDLMLPDGDGEDVVRAIRGRGLSTNVAVCTGSDDPQRLTALRVMGVEVLRKPVAADAIETICRRC